MTHITPSNILHIPSLTDKHGSDKHLGVRPLDSIGVKELEEILELCFWFLGHGFAIWGVKVQVFGWFGFMV